MNDWRARANAFGTVLRRNALAGATVAIAVLAAGSAVCLSPLPAMLLLGFCVAALASAAYLLFDAALFRLAASYAQEEDGLAAIDDVLDRAGLRSRPHETRPLAARLAGTRRILIVHRVLAAIAILLFATTLFFENARC